MGDPEARGVVRSRGREARKAIAGPARVDAENRLIHHLMSLSTLRHESGGVGRTIGLFIAHDGEPDLAPLVPWLRARRATVALPVVADGPGDYSMRFVAWHENEVLTVGRYGIAVPRSGPSVDPAVTVVSCVGFDSTGNRIGRGAGYFDRYLEGRDTVTVGVAFECQRVEAIAAEPHDVAMSIMVTDLGVRFVDRRRA